MADDPRGVMRTKLRRFDAQPTRAEAGVVLSLADGSTGFQGRFSSADSSRAIPTCERQSPRFDVTSTSITQSDPCRSITSTGKPPCVSASAPAPLRAGRADIVKAIPG